MSKLRALPSFRRSGVYLLPVALFASIILPVAAQSPNTATMLIEVVDETGAVVKDAKVTVVNAATGNGRDAVSGSDGSVTIAALPLTGSYTVSVAKAGFANEELKEITLRAGETATLKVKLSVGAAKAEVSVYGTADGVRADPEIGGRFDPAKIDELPILGRKTSSLPLYDASFRPRQGHRRSFRQSDLRSYRRRFAPHHHYHPGWRQ